MWMKVQGGRGSSALFIGCAYMPTDCTNSARMYLALRKKGRVVLLGDFNARVGKSVEMDNVIGMFGEDTCNASGNRLISFAVRRHLFLAFFVCASLFRAGQ